MSDKSSKYVIKRNCNITNDNYVQIILFYLKEKKLDDLISKFKIYRATPRLFEEDSNDQNESDENNDSNNLQEPPNVPSLSSELVKNTTQIINPKSKLNTVK